ncbi:hypothetical protein F5X99DRAFT_409465 [Biscogniauxia marginata]|nr:hypothetical protein F5X99DRAFT_409465 [Biscogniauxia marginata]
MQHGDAQGSESRPLCCKISITRPENPGGLLVGYYPVKAAYAVNADVVLHDRRSIAAESCTLTLDLHYLSPSVQSSSMELAGRHDVIEFQLPPALAVRVRGREFLLHETRLPKQGLLRERQMDMDGKVQPASRPARFLRVTTVKYAACTHHHQVLAVSVGLCCELENAGLPVWPSASCFVHEMAPAWSNMTTVRQGLGARQLPIDPDLPH